MGCASSHQYARDADNNSSSSSTCSGTGSGYSEDQFDQVVPVVGAAPGTGPESKHSNRPPQASAEDASDGGYFVNDFDASQSETEFSHISQFVASEFGSEHSVPATPRGLEGQARYAAKFTLIRPL